MKDYTIDGKNREKYIKCIEKHKDGTMSVIFADGRVFNNIDYCQENLEKVIAVQEEQAKKGIENYKKFKTGETKATALSIISGLFTLTFSTGVTMIPQVNEALSSQSPVVVATGIGLITILGTIPALAKLHREKSKVKELDKLSYRNKHKKELDSFSDYPNALSGLYPDTAKWISSTKDPFSILNVDEYSLYDLEQIVSNIKVEKEYDFTYRKNIKRSR